MPTRPLLRVGDRTQTPGQRVERFQSRDFMRGRRRIAGIRRLRVFLDVQANRLPRLGLIDAVLTPASLLDVLTEQFLTGAATGIQAGFVSIAAVPFDGHAILVEKILGRLIPDFLEIGIGCFFHSRAHPVAHLYRFFIG